MDSYLPLGITKLILALAYQALDSKCFCSPCPVATGGLRTRPLDQEDCAKAPFCNDALDLVPFGVDDERSAAETEN